MIVSFFRHATRDASALGDASLNELGRTQAESIKEEVTRAAPADRPHQLWTSPKIRAVQTFSPTSLSSGIELKILPALEERMRNETQKMFISRISRFLSDLEPLAAESPTSKQKIWICSHSDWLQDAMVLLSSDLGEEERDRHWAPAERQTFSWQNGLWVHDRDHSGLLILKASQTK